jgi:hypothetical protein
MPKKSKPRAGIPGLNEGKWLELESCAKIPNDPSSRQRFRHAIGELIRSSCYLRATLMADPRSGAVVPRLERIAQLANDLRQALSPKSVAGVVAVNFVETALPPSTDVDGILKQLIEAVDSARLQATQQLKSRGRTSEDRFLVLAPFLQRVDDAVARANGVRLTLDKNLRAGTMVDFLELLAPLLKPGFLPQGYISALHRFRRRLTLEKK